MPASKKNEQATKFVFSGGDATNLLMSLILIKKVQCAIITKYSHFIIA